MQYMLLFYDTAEGFACRNDARAAEYYAGWNAYIKALVAAGVVRGGNGLESPEAATVLRLRDGARELHDGPIADTKEQLGGYFIIEVDNLDAALGWAARAPCAGSGGVEIRPVMNPPAS